MNKFLNTQVLVTIREFEGKELVSPDLLDENQAVIGKKDEDQLNDELTAMDGKRVFAVAIECEGMQANYMSSIIEDEPLARAVCLSEVFLRMSKSLVNQFSSEPKEEKLLITL